MATFVFNHSSGDYDRFKSPNGDITLVDKDSILYPPTFRYRFSYTLESGERCHSGIYDAYTWSEAVSWAKWKAHWNGRRYITVTRVDF